jgi:ParB family chromosome partitioning protein
MTASPPPVVTKELCLDELEADPGQPRRFFGQEAIDELADSIRQHGMLQPIVVRLNAAGSVYRIIAGERRFRAARVAGLEAVPVRVLSNIDDAESFVLATVENVNRADLSD